MNLTNSLKLSLNSITHRKLRSWLTLLGIVIGVAAVVSIISIGQGAQQSVTKSLSQLGADTITLSPGFSRAKEMGGFRMPGGGREGIVSSDSDDPELTKRDVVIVRGNPNVEYVSEIVSGRGDLTFLSEESSVSIQGINPTAWKEINSLGLDSGRFLGASDSAAVVIGNRIANDLFKQPITIGRRISIEGKSFTIVGILKSSGMGFGGGGSDLTVYMPYSLAWEVIDIDKDTFSSLQIKVSDSELVEQTMEELKASLLLSRKVTEKDQDFTLSSSQEMQDQISETTQTLTLFLGAIAAVSLLVGAVGVANSMFTSVLEKTKLIGILKALGATNNEILLIFMFESGLFGFVGGLLGVIIGTLVSIGIGLFGIVELPMMRGGSTLVTPELVITAIILSTVIGIVSGILPARAAASLKPVEAIRYE